MTLKFEEQFKHRDEWFLNGGRVPDRRQDANPAMTRVSCNSANSVYPAGWRWRNHRATAAALGAAAACFADVDPGSMIIDRGEDRRSEVGKVKRE
jgi:hypothetical protein